MKIILTDESADVLARVEGMRRWSVAPTMTRGAKKAAVQATQKAKPSKGKLMKDAEKETKTDKKKSKKPATPKVIKLDVQEISQKSFRRHNSGRENISFMIKKLHELDIQTFGKTPAFDPFGVCRLRFEGAEGFKVDEILENAPKAIEFLHLSLLKLRNELRMKELCCIPVLKILKMVFVEALISEFQIVASFPSR